MPKTEKTVRFQSAVNRRDTLFLADGVRVTFDSNGVAEVPEHVFEQHFANHPVEGTYVRLDG